MKGRQLSRGWRGKQAVPSPGQNCKWTPWLLKSEILLLNPLMVIKMSPFSSLDRTVLYSLWFQQCQLFRTHITAFSWGPLFPFWLLFLPSPFPQGSLAPLAGRFSKYTEALKRETSSGTLSTFLVAGEACGGPGSELSATDPRCVCCRMELPMLPVHCRASQTGKVGGGGRGGLLGKEGLYHFLVEAGRPDKFSVLRRVKVWRKVPEVSNSMWGIIWQLS